MKKMRNGIPPFKDKRKENYGRFLRGTGMCNKVSLCNSHCYYIIQYIGRYMSRIFRRKQSRGREMYKTISIGVST